MACRESARSPGFPPRVQLPPFRVETEGGTSDMSVAYEKVRSRPSNRSVAQIPGPTGDHLGGCHHQSQVCIQDVLMNACQYFLLSYNSVQKAYWECPEGELKHTLANSMQSLEIAWGQVDALVTALNNAPPP